MHGRVRVGFQVALRRLPSSGDPLFRVWRWRSAPMLPSEPCGQCGVSRGLRGPLGEPRHSLRLRRLLVRRALASVSDVELACPWWVPEQAIAPSRSLSRSSTSSRRRRRRRRCRSLWLGSTSRSSRSSWRHRGGPHPPAREELAPKASRLMRNRRRRGRRRYEVLAGPRRRLGALRRRSSSAARSAIRSSSVISCHTVERRAPDRRTCPAASSS
jgi:hypothetical protein